MITRIGFAPRAAGMGMAAAQEHWRSEHAGLALQIPGLLAYTQNHAVLRDGRPLLPYPGFDVCSETRFADLASMDAGFASAHYQQEVRQDERTLIDPERLRYAVCEHRVVLDREVPPDAVKLMTFMRAGAGREELRLVFEGRYAEAVARAEPLRHEQLVALDEAEGEGRPPAAYDAVDMVWFAGADQALEALYGPLADAGWVIGGHARGNDRLLALPHLVR